MKGISRRRRRRRGRGDTEESRRMLCIFFLSFSVVFPSLTFET